MSDENAARRPANQNPWYVLMTLYGEQDGAEIDKALHERNREAWNIWAGFVLPEWIRNNCAAKGMALPATDTWLSRQDEIRTLHQAEMLRRNGPDYAYLGFPEPSQTEVINFSYVDFSCNVCAGALFFPANASFRSATFSGDAFFGSATFSGYASFGSASFSGTAEFGSAMFSGYAEFGSATFIGDAEFRSAAFSGDAVFGPTTFSGDAQFSAATFSGYAEFFSATFSGDAGFGGATFRGGAWFSSAAFSRYASFRSATFSVDAQFFSATFSGFTYFSDTQFGAPGENHTVAFTDSQFLKPTNFRAAIFHSQYPDLSGAVLHDKTEFTARPDNWPISTNQPAEDAKAACARIRHILGSQGLPEEEHFFYRREMTFACQIGSFWQRLPYRLFGLLSGFGYSIQRPVEALLLLWVCPAVFFFGHAQNGRLADYSEIGRALALSLANIFNFLGFHRTFFAPDHVLRLPAALQLLSGFQTLAGLPLLFFFGLALRTRFRLR